MIIQNANSALSEELSMLIQALCDLCAASEEMVVIQRSSCHVAGPLFLLP